MLAGPETLKVPRFQIAPAPPPAEPRSARFRETCAVALAMSITPRPEEPMRLVLLVALCESCDVPFRRIRTSEPADSARMKRSFAPVTTNEERVEYTSKVGQEVYKILQEAIDLRQAEGAE